MSQPVSKNRAKLGQKPASSLSSPMLLRQLQKLSGKDIPKSNARFSERLTQHLDFNGSLKLSEVHGQLRVLEKQYASLPAVDLKSAKHSVDGAYERVHGAIVRNIEQSFDAQIAQPKYPLPRLNLEAENLDFSVYIPFYQAHQSEMAAKVQGLKTYYRQLFMKLGPRLAQLVILDQMLDETVGLPLRSGFSAVSKVLSEHAEENQVNAKDAGRIERESLVSRFEQELQSVLLAELDIRLQTVQGLLDAFNHEVESSND